MLINKISLIILVVCTKYINKNWKLFYVICILFGILTRKNTNSQETTIVFIVLIWCIKKNIYKYIKNHLSYYNGYGHEFYKPFRVLKTIYLNNVILVTKIAGGKV